MNKPNGRPAKRAMVKNESVKEPKSFAVETSKEFQERVKRTVERIKALEKEIESLRVFVSGVVQLEADKHGVKDGDNITVSDQFDTMTISRNED